MDNCAIRLALRLGPLLASLLARGRRHIWHRVLQKTTGNPDVPWKCGRSMAWMSVCFGWA